MCLIFILTNQTVSRFDPFGFTHVGLIGMDAAATCNVKSAPIGEEPHADFNNRY